MSRLTILLLEAPWSTEFHTSDGWRPSVSVRPYLETLRANYGTQVIYRQITTSADIKLWCNALKHAKHLGRKVVWLAGHGKPKANGRSNYGIWVPDPRCRRASENAGI